MANDNQNSGIAGLKNQPTASSYTIDELYRQALGREADPEGLKYWTQQLGPTAEGKEIADFLSGAGYELMRTRYDPFSQQATTPAQSYKVEDLYQKALGREADTGGLEYWQKEIGPTAEGDEIIRFLQVAQPELLRTGITPFAGQTVDATTGRVKATQPASGQTAATMTGNPYLDYRQKMFELGDIENPRPAHIETAFEDYLAKQQKYETTGAKPNIAEFMDATGADFITASEILYGLVGSNEDRRDWQKIMSSKDPYTAAVAGLGQMYGGYGVQVSKPDERERQRAFLTTGQGTPLRMLGRYDPMSKAIDISPKEAAEYYNRAGVDVGALARRAGLNIAPRYDATTSPYDFSALINYLLGGKG